MDRLLSAFVRGLMQFVVFGGALFLIVIVVRLILDLVVKIFLSNKNDE